MAKADAAGADPFAIGKQFWDTWTGYAQGVMSGQTPQWGDPLSVFAKVAPDATGDMRHAAESLADQGRQFYAFLQAAASRMGIGEQLDATQVGELWRKTVADGNPLLDALRAATTQGSRGFEQMQADLLPWLSQWRGAIDQQLGTPAFGFTRERQEQWQALLRAQAEYAESSARYNALLAKASQRGMEYFENKLAERSEPGRQIDSARALYDLWVDAAEEAYAEIALSAEFREVYGAMTNALMRLRRAVQKEVEVQAASLGMPTRSEVDGAHQKLHALRAEVRALRRELDALRAGKPVAASEAAHTPAPGKPAAPASKASAKRATAKAAAKPKASAAAPRKASTAAPRKAATRSRRKEA